MITAYAVLHERITPLAIVGTALILLGVYMAERKKSGHQEDNETN